MYKRTSPGRHQLGRSPVDGVGDGYEPTITTLLKLVTNVGGRRAQGIPIWSMVADQATFVSNSVSLVMGVLSFYYVQLSRESLGVNLYFFQVPNGYTTNKQSTTLAR
jgi:hypothetical protein